LSLHLTHTERRHSAIQQQTVASRTVPVATYDMRARFKGPRIYVSTQDRLAEARFSLTAATLRVPVRWRNLT